MRKFITAIALASALGLAMQAGAANSNTNATPQDMVRDYEAAARRELPDAAFKANAARGEKFFRTERSTAAGDKMACAACHTADPRQSGQTRAHKKIEPLAPAANAARFSDPAKVEKWFGRNCNDVLGRPCTAAEKADFIAWLLTVK